MGSVAQKTVRIGVDVGAHHKTPTTPDVTEGIEAAVRNVLQKSGLPSESIASVTVGTTHFINAVIEQDARRLRRVAIIRISKSFLREVPPFSEFPPGLTSIIKGYVGYVDGGLHIDGSQEAPLVEEQVVERCAEIKKLGLSSIVIVGAFSPIDDHFHQEDRVRDVVLREIPEADVVVSHEVANIGLLERENAAILNAAILRYAKRTVKGFRRAMKALNLTCPLFLTQNDGTLLDSAAAAKIPIRTFSSGPTNSMRGAAYLTGHETGSQSAIVVDIGGTTSDVGVLLPSGLPRQASAYVTVAGVKVNYSMPSLHSIGLGGGSIVRQQDGKVTVGPDSVGHYLTRDALVFGGKVLTSSDIAAEERIKQLLEGAVDMIKTSPEPLPVLLVGGGAILAPSSLKGASELKLPPYHDVANAVGAAISKVGGIVDIIQQITDISQTQAVEKAKEMAIQKAVDAGATKESIIIAEVETYPVSYMANQLRTIVKAVGELDINMQPSSLDDDETDGEGGAPEAAKDFAIKVVDEPPVDPRTYKPTIVKNEQGILDPAASRIQLRDMLRAGYKMRCIRPEDLPEPGNIYWGGHMGSPATSNERLQSLETVKAFEALMEYVKDDTFDAVMGLEIGGANGIEPFLVGSSRFYDRPVIDADWMGRAYPTYWQTTLAVHAPGELVPCVIDSGDGKTIIMTKASNDEIVDRALRASCAEMGSRVGKAARPTTSQRVREYVSNTLSTVAEQIVEQVGGTKSAKVLFRGKIVGVERRLFKGHSYGTITIASLSASEDDDSADLKAQRLPAVKESGTLIIPFKNENIYVEHVDDDGTKSIIASVPDLICVLDAGSGKNLGVPEFKYGYRVFVIGITCSPRWSDTPRGLEIGGPGSFGYHHIEYKPLGEYVEPRSVIEEYAPK
ncbi:uncharacterized protein MYCFIDRAFT_153679 [Pseudocercospora fijiensis CIRAD86]|uniref:Hydantoinase/oxoprolinase n=1 Tax=Pseudocercospora fijiensis (strain CIRAD86) TaxID=383855 RepID=M3B0K3_PSEFD|nr:uncharacterized protein MYCFIDRAFT_153679 [Pseudocercospora fijiensis CIRAD86]EME82977.1 hypothetical protein MYCFIDRAFT_153679 [Pseudocercospora fijiensis CIRAD86]